MPSLELGPIRITTATERRVGTSAREMPKGHDAAAAKDLEAPVSGDLSAGEAPVDADRVAQIKKALENGTYPILPHRIADEMIAAGHILRMKK
ncbi:flagellar biosynthesis anti-sigma factor FlgM [Croceicoccus gelatinilyticus]|uniref:flagellar biosynthesis anti-sigma factor FlgM n=1 Tax=Croceicoccus gelatinilyticus TaxID=2835536 RepID=UPI001BD0B8FB|nr:flagellar biosynthesis anti-sigma factor FlgM [Croceicoccus gelatinilyticus]MBS7671306.1 flagellar biosynthesis anti-sigma factor FlgM [Croceicoccus gelatinilyticus]